MVMSRPQLWLNAKYKERAFLITPVTLPRPFACVWKENSEESKKLKRLEHKLNGQMNNSLSHITNDTTISLWKPRKHAQRENNWWLIITHLCDNGWLVDFFAVCPPIQTLLQRNFTHIYVHIWDDIILRVVSDNVQVKSWARAALWDAINHFQRDRLISPHLADTVVIRNKALVWRGITYKYDIGANKSIRQDAEGHC